jgi:hypothetical protein
VRFIIAADLILRFRHLSIYLRALALVTPAPDKCTQKHDTEYDVEHNKSRVVVAVDPREVLAFDRQIARRTFFTRWKATD